MVRKVSLALSLLFVGYLSAQKRSTNIAAACECGKKNEFIRKRDFEPQTTFTNSGAYGLSQKLLADPAPASHAFAYHLLAEHAMNRSDLSLGKLYLDREKTVLDSIGCKKNLYYYREYFVLLGSWYVKTGDFRQAIDCYNTASQILTKALDQNQKAQVLLGLTASYSRLGNSQKAGEYLKEAYGTVMDLADNAEKSNRLFELSARYYQRYRMTSDHVFLDSAWNVANYGQLLTKRIAYADGYYNMYNLLEDHEYYEKNYQSAILYLDSALRFTSGPNFINERNGIYADMAEIYLELKQYNKAYVAADSALSYSKLSNNPWEVTNALELLYNCAKLNGEYERALVVYEDLSGMRDSVRQLQNRQAYGELEDKYHRIRKEKSESEYEQDKKLMHQQREIGKLRHKLIIIGIVVVTLLLFYIIIVLRQRSIKSRQQHLEVEKRLEQARINPDFLYGTLNDLQKLASSQTGSDNNGIAAKLSLMKKLVKRSLDSSHDDFLTLDKEEEFLTAYLDLQRDRTNKGFSYRFEIDPSLDRANVCVPAMILQPFLENTVEKGFRNLAYPGEILVSIEKRGHDELYISIQDNGNGLKAGNSTRASEIISDRLFLLNKRNKGAASYLIKERLSGGIIVEVFLPLITREMAESYSKDL